MVRIVALSMCLVVAAGSMVPAADGYESRRRPAQEPMPFGLVAGRRVLGDGNDPIALSRDGRLVAYTVYTPPAGGRPDTHWLPGDVPSVSIGKSVLINEITGTSTILASPEDRNCWRPSFSPDSKRVAFYCDSATGAGAHLWVYDIERRSPRQVSDAKIKVKLWRGDEPVWNPAGTEIYVPLAPEPGSLQIRAGLAESTTAGVLIQRAGLPKDAAPVSQDLAQAAATIENGANLARVKLSDGVATVVVPLSSKPQPSVLQLSPGGAWLAYLSTSRTEVALVPTTGGPILPIVSGLARDISPDTWLTAFCWHPSRDQLFWVRDGSLWTFDAGTHGAVPAKSSGALSDLTRTPMAFAPDGSFVVVGASPMSIDNFQAARPTALAVIPLDDRAPRKLPPLGDGLSIDSVLVGDRHVLQSADRMTVICRDRDGLRRAVTIDLATGAQKTDWQGYADIRFAGIGATGEAIGTYEDFNTPENLYKFKRDYSQKQAVTQVDNRLAGYTFQSPETFETLVPRHDGELVPVTSAILMPKGAKQGDRLPTLLVQYPGLSLSGRVAVSFGGGESALSLPLSIFTTRGYAVLLVDSPIGPFKEAGNLVEELRDVVLPQIFHAAALGYTDLRRVAVLGHSFGGYGTAALISSTNLFRAAVAISGMYDLGGWLPGLRVGAPNRMGALPWDDPQRYIANSPYYRAAHIRTPLLLVHGDKDVAIDEARKLFNSLTRLGRPAELAVYEGEGHNISDWAPDRAADAGQRIVEFLNTYLMPSTESR